MMGPIGTALRGYLDRRAPGYLVFFVTPLCNCRCKMCFHTAVLDQASQREVLSLEEIERIARKWPGLHNLNLSGGEPFLREDLPELASLFYRHSAARFITCTTNSSRPEQTEAMVRDLCERCPDAAIRIVQSLDGVGALHDSIRGREGLFEHVVELNGRLARLQSCHANLGVNVVTTLSSLNNKQDEELLDYVYDNLHFDDYGALLVRGHTFDPAAGKLEPEVIQRFQRAHADRSAARAGASGGAAQTYSALNRLVSELVVEVAMKDRFVTPCRAGRAMVVMDDQGAVEPCEILDGFISEGKVPLGSSRLGSMREFGYDIRSILANRHARQVVETIVSSKCRCTYECAMAVNVLYTPPLLLRTLVRVARGRAERWFGQSSGLQRAGRRSLGDG